MLISTHLSRAIAHSPRTTSQPNLTEGRMEHEIVSRDEWTAARQTLLAKEKAMSRARDELSAARRALPWVRVEKNYVFEGRRGQETLADLFADKSQLVVQHFMLGPGWKEGCVGCSF